MTRGRKKDLTIPPSRSLTQQRDYRARRAQYIAELEERCRRAEEENTTLRRDLETLRASLPLPFAAMENSQLMSASTELIKHLSAAYTALLHFRELAYDPSDKDLNVPSPSAPSPLPSPRQPTASLEHHHSDRHACAYASPPPSTSSTTALTSLSPLMLGEHPQAKVIRKRPTGFPSPSISEVSLQPESTRPRDRDRDRPEFEYNRDPSEEADMDMEMDSSSQSSASSPGISIPRNVHPISDSLRKILCQNLPLDGSSGPGSNTRSVRGFEQG